MATGAAVLSTLIGLVGVSWQWRVAELQRARAETGTLLARRNSYASDMNLLQQALEARALGGALWLLERNRPRPGEVDLRHWEWRYFWERCRSDALYTFCQHSNLVTALAFVNKGKWLAVGDIDGAVRLWDVATRSKVAELQDEGACWSLAASEDGTLLAAGGTDRGGNGLVRVWEVTGRREQAQFPQRGLVRSVALSRDGSQLLTWEHNGYVRLWDVANQELIANVAPSPRKMRDAGVVRFSPRDQSLVIGDGEGNIRFFDRAETNSSRSVKAHAYGITALAFSPDGALLASAGTYSEGRIRIWAADSGMEVGELVGYNNWVSSLAFSPDGKTLISGSADQTIRLWDVVSRRELAVYLGHLSEVFALSVCPDGQMLVSGAKDGSVLAWSVKPMPRPSALMTFPARPNTDFLAFAPNGESFAVLAPDGAVIRRETTTLREMERLVSLGTNNSALAFSPSGRFLTAGDDVGRVKIWDLVKGTLAASLSSHTGVISFVRFTSGDGALLAVDREKV